MLFLVVDDDGMSRELLTLLLEAEGHEVQATASGEEALELLGALPRAASQNRAAPDVILTDIQMPGLAGDALAKALREATAGRQTLLLAMSGSQPGEAALARFDGFLLKPFKVNELESMISASGKLAAGTPAQETMCLHASDADESGVTPLDEEIYTKLSELIPREQLAEMYALCVGDARKRIAHMQELAEAGDDAQYRAEAHTVKGGSGMIGAKELYTFSAAAERDGLPTDTAALGTTGVTAALTQLSFACDRLERILGERTRE